MKYKIVKSTSNQFNGIVFYSDNLNVQDIQNAIGVSVPNILIYEKNKHNEYVCANKHFVLIIKEEV